MGMVHIIASVLLVSGLAWGAASKPHGKETAPRGKKRPVEVQRGPAIPTDEQVEADIEDVKEYEASLRALQGLNTEGKASWNAMPTGESNRQPQSMSDPVAE